MRRSCFLWLLWGLLGFFSFISTELAAQSTNGTSRAADYFAKYDWQSFRDVEQARAALDPGRVNTNLLSAAVFHETNRRRHQHKLPLLLHHPTVTRVADLQSVIMRDKGDISHENPERPDLKTLMDRLAKMKLEPRFAAENVATAFGLQYRSGRPFYTRSESGKKVFSYQPNGPAIRRHNYLTFAEALVDSWMNSPGHRKNILHPDPKYLGASCRPSVDRDTGMPLYYCTQVFYTPLRQSPTK